MITKKVGTTGRFGSRYGTKVRMKVATVEKVSRAKHQCPSCLKTSLKKISKGVWECRSCDVKIAGGAYAPASPAAKILKQIVK
ncbi:MAG: 50S ribosomal protein L37ae [archaeon]